MQVLTKFLFGQDNNSSSTDSDSADSTETEDEESPGSVLTSGISEEAQFDSETELIEPLDLLDFDQVTFMNPASTYFLGSKLNAGLFSPPNQRAKILS